jgi:hypothetical protein
MVIIVNQGGGGGWQLQLPIIPFWMNLIVTSFSTLVKMELSKTLLGAEKTVTNKYSTEQHLALVLDNYAGKQLS